MLERAECRPERFRLGNLRALRFAQASKGDQGHRHGVDALHRFGFDQAFSRFVRRVRHQGLIRCRWGGLRGIGHSDQSLGKPSKLSNAGGGEDLEVAACWNGQRFQAGDPQPARA